VDPHTLTQQLFPTFSNLVTEGDDVEDAFYNRHEDVSVVNRRAQGVLQGCRSFLNSYGRTLLQDTNYTPGEGNGQQMAHRVESVANTMSKIIGLLPEAQARDKAAREKDPRDTWFYKVFGVNPEDFLKKFQTITLVVGGTVAVVAAVYVYSTLRKR